MCNNFKKTDTTIYTANAHTSVASAMYQRHTVHAKHVILHEHKISPLLKHIGSCLLSALKDYSDSDFTLYCIRNEVNVSYTSTQYFRVHRKWGRTFTRRLIALPKTARLSCANKHRSQNRHSLGVGILA